MGRASVTLLRYRRVVAIGAALVLALAAAGCGGGSSGGSTTPTPSTVSVTISPTSATIGYSATQQFTATVSGSTNTAVTWTVSNANSSSSTQIGSIDSSGLYTAPAATSLSAANTPTTVSVLAGQTASANVSVPPLNSITSVTVTATSQADTSQSASATVTFSGISIIAVGQCDLSTSKCSADATGTEVSQGQTVYLFVAGFGILPGTTYSISGNDVSVTQPSSSSFQLASDNTTPTVYFPITVSSSATLGPRNLVVKNSGGELAAFPGAISITQ